MSKLPELVYQSTSPEAAAWWHNLVALREQERLARKAFVDEMTELYGPSPRRDYEASDDGVQTRREVWVRGRHGDVYALDSGYDERPPADSGWRLDSKDRNWQPKLATKAGKELAKRLADLNIVNWDTELQKIGVPQIVFIDMRMYSPGVRFDEDSLTLYLTWGSQHVAEQVEKNFSRGEIQLVWEQMKLSQYMAYLEMKGEI